MTSNASEGYLFTWEISGSRSRSYGSEGERVNLQVNRIQLWKMNELMQNGVKISYKNP